MCEEDYNVRQKVQGQRSKDTERRNSLVSKENQKQFSNSRAVIFNLGCSAESSQELYKLDHGHTPPQTYEIFISGEGGHWSVFKLLM